MAKTIEENNLIYVQALRDRGEKVLKLKGGDAIGSIKGYIKTQIPHKDVGSIFKDKDGKFGLFGDMGTMHITGLNWDDLGLCDARCWYEWMNPEEYKKSAQLGYATTRELLQEIMARIEIDGRLDYRTVDE